MTPQSDNRVSTFHDNNGLCLNVLDCAGSLWCLLEVMESGSHWFVSLRWETNDVPHCPLLSSDDIKRRLVSATLCWRWSHCLDDQLWLFDAYAKRRKVLWQCWSESRKSICPLKPVPIYSHWFSSGLSRKRKWGGTCKLMTNRKTAMKIDVVVASCGRYQYR